MPSFEASDGVRLHYRTRGRGGPALVFIHGWCGRLDNWDSQLRHFAKKRRVLAHDRRGHGRSDTPQTGYTAERHANDLLGILRRERIRRSVLIAHAGGGPTALAFAAAHPDRVRALVLIDSNVGPRAQIGDPSDAGGAAFAAMIEQIEGPSGDAGLTTLYSSLFSPFARTIGRRAVQQALSMPREVVVEELASLAIDSQALARKLDLPVLWISAGAIDEDRLASVFRRLEFGRVVGSGHFPQLEVPEQLNAMLDRFLQTL